MSLRERESILRIIFSLVLFFSSLFDSFCLAHTSCEFTNSIYLTGRMHFDNNQFLMSAAHFSMLKDYPCNESIQDKAKFGYLLSLWKLEDTLELDRQLDLLPGTIKSLHIKEKSRLFAAFLGKSERDQIGGTDLLKLKLWESRFDSDKFSRLVMGDSSIEQPQIIGIQQSYEEIKLKSPYLAGSLSLIPGLGQLYNGTYESAAVAFGLNLILGLATVEFFSNHLDAAGTASSLVFSVTYFGNILSAYNGAHQINLSRTKHIDQKFQDQIFQFRPVP